MKRLAIFAAALLALTALASESFGFQPTISLQYGGETVALQAASTANADGTTDWSFVTPDGKLAVCVNLKKEPGYPAYRMTSRVKNLSTTEETDVVSNLRVFASEFSLPSADSSVTLNTLLGSECKPQDFEPVEFVVNAGEEKVLEIRSGRSSSELCPYVEANVDARNGWFFAIGWTGNWRAGFKNADGKLTVELGMARANFKLLPGESLLQPSILFFERTDMTRREFKTVVHRYMRDFNTPRKADGSICEPIVAITAGGGNKTPQMMIDVLNYGLKNDIPFDVFWVDAGWYGEPHEAEPYSNCGPLWWRYVGQWIVNTTTHPTGDLLPIANAVHDAGKRFLLWFEPERIHGETPLAQQEPFNKQYGMCYYGNPESLAYMQETIYGIIEKHHIDVYRQDFNMEPTGAWTAIENDEGPDSVGVAEAKHVEGLYKFLDDMRAKFPGLEQENCASGGRRIDIEMVKRAHSYCRSDYYIGPKPGDTCFNLGQDNTLNLTPYLPFQGGETNCVANFDDYGFMSVASSGTVFTPTDLDGGIVKREFTPEETAWHKKMMGWAYRLKAYYMGDFYQLTDETRAVDDCWCAWSCDRPDEKDGFVVAFRRAENDEPTQTFELPAIDPSAKYEVEYYDGTVKTVDGAELANLTVTLENPRSFFLIVYKKI